MYIFEARYDCMDIGSAESVSRTIKVEDQFLADDKEAYIYAMSKAYELKKPNECLSALEFICC